MFQHVDATFRMCIVVLTRPPGGDDKTPAGRYFRCLVRAVAGAVQGSSGHGCLG